MVARKVGLDGVSLLGLPGHVYIALELRLKVNEGKEFTADVNPFPDGEQYHFMGETEDESFSPPFSSIFPIAIIDTFSKGAFVPPWIPIQSTSYSQMRMPNGLVYIPRTSMKDIWARALYNLCGCFDRGRDFERVYDTISQLAAIAGGLEALPIALQDKHAHIGRSLRKTGNRSCLV